jgi:hypothetical protein
MTDIGPQCSPDDSFTAGARLRQSKYGGLVLGVDSRDTETGSAMRRLGPMATHSSRHAHSEAVSIR